MKKRLSGMALLAFTLVFMSVGTVHADFVKNGSATMYQTESGSYLKGLQQINGAYYYFDASGVLKKNGWFTASDGKEYYATQNGALLVNQWTNEGYYLKENGEKAKGITRIGSQLFFFSPTTGQLQVGKLKDAAGNMYITDSKGVVYCGTIFQYKNKYYYADAEGKLAKGLTKVGNDNYFFRKTNGKMVVSAKRKVNGAVYYFTMNGRAAHDTWVQIGGNYYYFESDCRMATSKYVDDQWYVDENGVRMSAASAPKSTARKVNGKTYLYSADGNILASQWVKVNGKTYYAGTDGAALIGLQSIGGVRYYFNEDGVMQVSTTVTVGGVSYTIGADGKITDAKDPSEAASGSKGATIAAYAQQFVGNPYVYGGTDLTKGADCSGFCYTVFGNHGIQLLRVADDQMKGPSAAYQQQGYKKGTVISDANLLPGDLVFYGSSSYASHVAIYIGNGKIVHAANSRLGIIISDLDYVKSRVKDKNMRYWA